MAETPLYDIGETVYYRESAALGFLEAIKLESIHHVACQGIKYKICRSFSGPDINTTFGERITHRGLPDIYIREDELVLYDEAVCLVEQSLEVQLNNIRALKPPEGTCDVN
jgi:hypothetical protein